MIDYITQNIGTSWLVVGAFFIALEAMAIPGIGFLFTGLGALTIGGLITFGVIDAAAYVEQLALFLGISVVWAGLLWYPLKKFHSKSMENNFNNIVGDLAVIDQESLAPGEIGNVKWSGTIMRAKLDSSIEQTLQLGQTVIITDMTGNVLTVTLEGK